ncbi:MAG TPA: hypothetical protein PKE44_15690, partial [Plasticicumulans sp.]|uniref:hypothetical protein n=1 Tax=Plasticicumulans sp. TaxID=2307179 RepID=UPI002C5EF377
ASYAAITAGRIMRLRDRSAKRSQARRRAQTLLHRKNSLQQETAGSAAQPGICPESPDFGRKRPSSA